MKQPKRNKYRTITADQEKAAKKEIKRLFASFHTDFLAEKSGINAANLRVYKGRDHISPFFASEVCKIREVIDAGFTREKLRPDVFIWFDEV